MLFLAKLVEVKNSALIILKNIFQNYKHLNFILKRVTYISIIRLKVEIILI